MDDVPKFTGGCRNRGKVVALGTSLGGALRPGPSGIRLGDGVNRDQALFVERGTMVNPYIRGGINYYSHFYQSAARHDSLRRIDFHLRKWARRKHKRFQQKPKKPREGTHSSL